MKQPIFSDKHFYIWLALFIACTIFYYFGELVNLFGWEGLRWEIFYTVHDPHRMLFLIPILYSSYYYRLRGALLANVMSLLIFLPRAFFISPYPDATLRMVAFVILTIVISMLTALTFNDRDKRHKLTDALKKAEDKNRIVLEQMYDSFYEVDLAGNFTFVNDAACLNLGYSREELRGVASKSPCLKMRQRRYFKLITRHIYQGSRIRDLLLKSGAKTALLDLPSPRLPF